MARPIFPEISDKLDEGFRRTLASFRAALASRNPDRWSVALQIAMQHFDCECALITEVRNETITVAYSAGDHRLNSDQVPAPGRTLCGLAQRGHDAVQVPQLSRSPLSDLVTLVDFDVERFLAVPLDVVGRRFGSLNFYSRRAGSAVSPASEKKLLLAIRAWVEHTLFLDGHWRHRSAAEDPRADRPPPSPSSVLNEIELETVLGSIGVELFRFSRTHGFQQAPSTPSRVHNDRDATSREADASELLESVHPDDRAALLRRLEPLRDGLIPGGTWTFRKKAADGAYRTVEGTVSPSPDGDGHSTWVGALQDVTRERGSQETLQHRIEDLEGFSRIVAHDILAPLRHASKVAAILREDYETALDEDGLRLINLIETSATRGLNMLHGLTGYVQSTAKPSATELVAVRDLLKTLVREAVALHGRGGEQIQLPTREVAIWSSSAELSLILSNLITNALKYGGSPQELQVVVEDEPHHTTIRISDNGSGIADADKARVFQAFFRLKRDGPQEGTGLGLATVRNLVLARGGTISIEDRRDAQGTTVVVSYPHRP